MPTLSEENKSQRIFGEFNQDFAVIERAAKREKLLRRCAWVLLCLLGSLLIWKLLGPRFAAYSAAFGLLWISEHKRPLVRLLFLSSLFLLVGCLSYYMLLGFDMGVSDFVTLAVVLGLFWHSEKPDRAT